MALPAFLALASFFDLLPIRSCDFDLPEMVTVSRTRGGELLPAEIGTRLWTGEVTLDLMTRDEAAAVRPVINLLRGAGRFFLMADPVRLFPRRDPAGTALGTAAVALNTVTTREITLKGLPAGYVLSRGDLLSFQYGTNPVRYALHEVVNDTVTAAAGGTTPAIEVNPPIRDGAAPDLAVSLRRPACKALIVPGSVEPGSSRSGGKVEGVSFRFQQTLR